MQSTSERLEARCYPKDRITPSSLDQRSVAMVAQPSPAI